MPQRASWVILLAQILVLQQCQGSGRTTWRDSKPERKDCQRLSFKPARLRGLSPTRTKTVAFRNGGHDFSAIFADRRVFFRWVLFLRTHPGDTTVCVAGSAAPAERPTTRGRRSQ